MTILHPSSLKTFFLILTGNKDKHKSLDKLEFGQIPSLTKELNAHDHLKNIVLTGFFLHLYSDLLNT